MSSEPGRPLLSIITVTRNDAAGLRKTLTSLQSQTDLSRVEHLIIDGDSSDETAEVVREFSLGFSSFHSEPDRGTYDAMNKGLARSRGEFVQFLNSGDAFVAPDSLTHLCELLEQRPAWLIAGAVDEHGGHRPPTLIRNIPHVWWRHALGFQPHCHQTTVISREMLDLLGGHDERFGFVADFDVILRAGLIAKPAILEEVVVRYEGGGLSAQRQSEIPRALADVRRDRLGLQGLADRLNSALARYQEARFRLGRRLGR